MHSIALKVWLSLSEYSMSIIFVYMICMVDTLISLAVFIVVLGNLHKMLIRVSIWHFLNYLYNLQVV
jgi:hypothetical protein